MGEEDEAIVYGINTTAPSGITIEEPISILRAILANRTQAVQSEAGMDTQYDPLLLSNDWPKAGRLILLTLCSFFGSLMNSFFVTAHYIEPELIRPGNLYLTCAGAADLLITALVMPISAIAILSDGYWKSLVMCKVAQIAAQTATYAYTGMFFMVSIENYFRSPHISSAYYMYTSQWSKVVSTVITTCSFGLALIGVVFDLDYDYCERSCCGNTSFRVATSICYHIFLCFATLVLLYSTVAKIHRANYTRSQRRGYVYRRCQDDYKNAALNLMAYVIFTLMWSPYYVVVNEYPTLSDEHYYNFAWMGLSRSVFTSFLYGILHKDYRRAFANLYKYCFRKIALPRRARRQGRVTYNNRAGEATVRCAPNFNETLGI